MEMDSSRQQIPDMLEREETPLTTSSEPQLQSPQRSPNKWILWPRFSEPDKDSHPPPWEEDLQPEDCPRGPEKKILKNIFGNQTNISDSRRKQIPDMPEREELPLTTSYESQLHPCSLGKNILKLESHYFQNHDCIEKQTNISDKTEPFTDMKLYMTLDEESSIDVMPPGEPKKSVTNGDVIIFPAVYPDHPENRKNTASVPTKKHSEEILIQHIDDFLLKNETKVQKLLVYSHNSPCLRKEKNTACFMSLLLQKAAECRSMFGFSTKVTNVKLIFDLIDLVKDSFEKQTNISDKSELFTKIKLHLTLDEESSIEIMPPGEPMKSVLACYHDKHQGEEKQYAFAIAYLKNGGVFIFPGVYPDHPKKRKNTADDPTKKHSEEILIQHIDDFLLKNGTNVIKLLVYSYNSPCLRRERNTVCCMSLLLQKAAEWHNMYGFSTEVAFTKFWGLTGPNFFKGLTYSDISDQGSVFFPYIEKCKDIPFKLVSKRKENELRQKLRKMSANSTIYETIHHVEPKYRDKLLSSIKSLLNNLVDLAKSSSHTKDYLDRGIKIITSSEFHPEVRDEIVPTLTENWKEVVINESMSPIREKITTDFNTAVVQLFVKELKFFWGDSSPLKLYQVSQNMEGEGEYVQSIRELLNLN